MKGIISSGRQLLSANVHSLNSTSTNKHKLASLPELHGLIRMVGYF